MLQSFRDNIKGVTAFILVGLLIIPFAFFGVESLFVSGSSVDQAATVDGVKITELEVARGIEFQKQRILSQFEDMDPALLDDERLRGPVLDQLIRQKLLVLTAKQEGMAIPDQTFNQIILSNEAFKTEGKFDQALYEYHLARLGFSPLEYRQSVKEELLANHFSVGIRATAFTTQAELNDFGRLALQQRSFDYITFNQKDVTDIEVSDEEITAYYDQNKSQLAEPDKAIIEYIELTPELLESRVELDESEVEARLKDENATAATAGKTWQIAHILIDSTEIEARKKAVAEVEAKLEAGADFGALAKQYSADFGSAESGGELGTFTLEALPEGFPVVVRSLAIGEVSKPTELETGTHFIKLLDASDLSESQPLVTREQVEFELRRELAVEKLPTVLNQLKEETFSVDSLATVAEMLQLPVAISQPFTREGGGGVSQYPAVYGATFSDDVLKEGFASEVLELEENHYVVLKLKQFIPSHIPEQAEVTDSLKEIVSIQKAQMATKQRGEEMLISLRSGISFEDAATTAGASVKSETKVTRFDQRVPQALGDAVFQQPLSIELPFYGMSTALNGDIVVYAIKEIAPGSAGDLSAEEQRSMKLSLAQLSGARGFEAYANVLESQADTSQRSELPSNK